MKQTPLNQIHKQLGARMVDFGGWEMPVQYKGVMAEHECVRNQVGLFDISHMGEIFVTGKKARDFINTITTNDITKINDGGCQYAVCCYENGGVVDDVISYQFNPEKYLVVVNAANTDKDEQWFLKNKSDGVAIENQSPQFCQLALQGPKAAATLQALVGFDLNELKYFKFKVIQLLGCEVILSRTGYTGEDGFEIYGAWDKAEVFWNALLEAGQAHGIQPIGLAARDTLRLESAYSLYGHEISENINPLEARLGWVVKLDKSDFIGKKALSSVKEQGPKRKLVGLEMIDKGIPREGYDVYSGEEKVGCITSGTYSPSSKKAIAMALVDVEKTTEQNELAIQIRNKNQKAKIVKLPFYQKG